jgi:hypothetical protein
MASWLLRVIAFEVVAIIVMFILMIGASELLGVGTVLGVAIGLVVHYVVFFGLVLYDLDWDGTFGYG